MNLKAYGDTALLLDCESLDEAQSWFAALHRDADAVLGARSVLLRGEPSELRSLVGRTTPVDPTAGLDGPEIEIPVVYDGADLDDVARLTGLTATEVVEAHAGQPWTVAFGGFAPGFSYLVGGTLASTCRGATRRGAGCPPGRSGWPGSSAASIHGSRRVAGSSSAAPTSRCGTPPATSRRCWWPG